MKTFVFLIICLVASAEPAALVKRRKVYLSALQKLEAEHRQKVKKLTWRYIHGLNKIKVLYTKAGKLEDALAVRAEIEELKDATGQEKKPTTPRAPAGRHISKVVVHQTTNGHWKNGGTKSGTLTWYYGTRKGASKKFKLDWVPGKNASVEIRVSTMRRITKIRIECDAGDVRYAALAEIEVFDNRKRNISADAKLEVSSTFPKGPHRRGALVDGATNANSDLNWLATGKSGWVELTWPK